MATDRPRLSDEVLERLAEGRPSKKDAAELRGYVVYMEGRLAARIADSMLEIGQGISDIRRLADDGREVGRINGQRIDRLAEVVDALPGRLGGILDAHEQRAMETLRPLHEAAQRALVAEAARVELENESQRIELDGKRREMQNKHDNMMSARDLLIHSLKTYPWFWAVVWLLAGAMGLSIDKLTQMIGIGVPAPTVEAGP